MCKSLFICLAFVSLRVVAETLTIRNAEAYRQYVERQDETSAQFDIVATVTALPGNGRIIVQDAYGRIPVRGAACDQAKIGDRLRITGNLSHKIEGSLTRRTVGHSLTANRVEFIGRGNIPSVPDVSVGDIVSGRHNLQTVRLTARVDDLLPDDVDPGWNIMVVREGADTVLVSLPSSLTLDDSGGSLIGTRIAVTGFCEYSHAGVRKLTGWRILPPRSVRLEILEPANAKDQTVRRLEPMDKIGPETVAALGRRQATGRVVAVWQGNSLLLRDKLGQNIVVELAFGESLPPCGACIRAIGRAETDLFRINLTSAQVTMLEKPVTHFFDSQYITPKDLYFTENGHVAFNATCFGRTISACGTIRTMPLSGSAQGRLTLDCQGVILPIDTSACPRVLQGLDVGFTVRIRGVLIHETANWRPTQPFPRITGLFAVLRSPDDLMIVKTTPWWTPRRLGLFIAVLLASLFVISIWNFLLRRLAERRGRQLAAESIARAESDLRVCERTRLAVELHDSLAQYLTGASLELQAAERFRSSTPPELQQHLDLVRKTIDSSRDEIRNCIWDLRNRALEEPDFDRAIRLTLAPHLGETALQVRFNVPRDLVSDTSAHTMLCIIRELSVNAIRHGHATMIRVAGAIEDNKLLFSVRDDGCGFDPKSSPGMELGHFGLEGVRERVQQFKGRLSVESNAGVGSKFSVLIHMPPQDSK